MARATIGVLGGMGPEATVRLYGLLVSHTPAKRDQDHLRILVDNNSNIPDRTAAILDGGADPLTELEASARLLERAGASFLVIPCNTAHHWLPRLRSRVGIPILDMVGETATAVSEHRPALRRVGLLATTGTLRTQLYPSALRVGGVTTLEPTAEEQARVMAVIYGIKAGDRGVRPDLVRLGRILLERGAAALILGCTELSLVDEMHALGCPLFDPLDIVARRAVEVALSWDGPRGRASLSG